MSENLPESGSWEDGVYQLKTTDPVVGGTPNLPAGQGISNVPLQQLANRTSYLKTAVDALQLDGLVFKYWQTNLDALTGTQAFSFGQSAVGAPAGYGNFTGAGWMFDYGGNRVQFVTLREVASAPILTRSNDGSGWSQWFGGDFWRDGDAPFATNAQALAGTANDKIMSPLRVKQALDQLVGAAPGALDTLEELATALQDNDSDIAAINTAISGKVPNGRRVLSGAGLNGGGTLDADRTISVDLATVAEAEDGLLFGKIMSAQRTMDFAKKNLLRDVGTITDLDAQLGNCFFKFTMVGATGAPPEPDTGDAVGWQIDVGTQRTQYVTMRTGPKYALWTRTNDGAGFADWHRLKVSGEWDYVSPATALTANTSYSFVHGLLDQPSRVTFELECKSANNGYTIGDRILGVHFSGMAESNRGILCYVDNGDLASIKVVVGGALRFLSTTGTEVPLSFSDWDLIVKADQ